MHLGLMLSFYPLLYQRLRRRVQKQILKDVDDNKSVKSIFLQ